MKKQDLSQKELLIRIDERVMTIQKAVDEHNRKIDDLCNGYIHLKTTMTNHVNLHKRDLGIISIGLAVLTLVINYLV